MSWERGTRPKRLRRKHKRIVIVVAFVASILLVSVISFYKGMSFDGKVDILGKIAESVLSEEEKRIVWEGMSEQGREVLRKHAPSSTPP